MKTEVKRFCAFRGSECGSEAHHFKKKMKEIKAERHQSFFVRFFSETHTASNRILTIVLNPQYHACSYVHGQKLVRVHENDF